MLSTDLHEQLAFRSSQYFAPLRPVYIRGSGRSCGSLLYYMTSVDNSSIKVLSFVSGSIERKVKKKNRNGYKVVVVVTAAATSVVLTVRRSY